MPKYMVTLKTGQIFDAETEEEAQRIGEDWAVDMNQRSFGIKNPDPIPEGSGRAIYGLDVRVTDVTQAIAEFRAMGQRYLREDETLSTVTAADIWERMHGLG